MRFCSICFVLVAGIYGHAADFLPVVPYTMQPEELFREFGFETTWNLEDFESGEISKSGLIIESKDPWRIRQGFSVARDAGTGEDGYALEATHTSCAASFPRLCPATVTMSFDRSVFETLPSYVGFVWTDAESAGDDSVFPYAKVVVTNARGEESTQLLGSVSGADGGIATQPFIGLVDEAGVRSVQFTVITDGSGMGGHLTLDHFQFGLTAIPGDTDIDGDVDFADFVQLSRGFGAVDTGWADGDFDFDGTTGFSDFLDLSMNFGITGQLRASFVPEPSGNLLFLGAGLCLVAWSRGSKLARRDARVPHIIEACGTYDRAPMKSKACTRFSRRRLPR